MNQPIEYTVGGNIHLNLLKSQIDRKITLILHLLTSEPSTVSQPSSRSYNHQKSNSFLSQTPIKEGLADLSRSNNQSHSSASKQKIEHSRDKCFGNLVDLNGDLLNKLPLCTKTNTKKILTHESKEETERSKQNRERSEYRKEKPQTKRTPNITKPTHSKTPSAVKKVPTNQPQGQRNTISQEVFEQMAEKTKGVTRKDRRELRDNNVRFNLLRRIEAMARSSQVLDMQII